MGQRHLCDDVCIATPIALKAEMRKIAVTKLVTKYNPK